MKRYLLYVVSAAQFFLSSSLCAQGIGEYGRAVGGIPRLGPTAPGSAPQVGSGRPRSVVLVRKRPSNPPHSSR
jgi:hypothetical protein